MAQYAKFSGATYQKVAAQFRAKFPSTCPVCGNPIRVGDMIDWQQGKRATHAQCAESAAANVPPQPTLAPPAKAPSEKIIPAKFPSTCPVCGQRIREGEMIAWRPGAKAKHVKCPVAVPPAPKEPAPFVLTRSSNRQGFDFIKGQVIRTSDVLRKRGYPDFVTVVRTSREYFNEDGLSFGLNDDQGYLYRAECRAATPEEIAPLLAAEEKEKVKRDAAQRVKDIAAKIQSTGEYPQPPDGKQMLVDGDRLFDTQTIYGGGTWFVVEPNQWIWYVQNNGGDGDDWHRNNVQTGGAGAIGRRIPYDEALAQELRTLQSILQGK